MITEYATYILAIIALMVAMASIFTSIQKSIEDTYISIKMQDLLEKYASYIAYEYKIAKESESNLIVSNISLYLPRKIAKYDYAIFFNNTSKNLCIRSINKQHCIKLAIDATISGVAHSAYDTHYIETRKINNQILIKIH